MPSPLLEMKRYPILSNVGKCVSFLGLFWEYGSQHLVFSNFHLRMVSCHERQGVTPLGCKEPATAGSG